MKSPELVFFHNLSTIIICRKQQRLIAGRKDRKRVTIHQRNFDERKSVVLSIN